MIFVNYFIKALIVLVGIFLVSGIWTPENGDPTAFRVFGIVCILLGIYRIAVYRTKLKRNRDNDED